MYNYLRLNRLKLFFFPLVALDAAHFGLFTGLFDVGSGSNVFNPAPPVKDGSYLFHRVALRLRQPECLVNVSFSCAKLTLVSKKVK